MNIIKDIFNDHKMYGSQILKLAKADLVKTYRGSALGWAWALVKPVMTIFVFWFAFTYGLRIKPGVDDFPFFLWLIAGFVPWFYMSGMISGGAACIRVNSHLVTKMHFPASVVPTFTSLSRLFINILLIVIMLIIFVAFGHPPTIYYLNIPVYLFMMFLWFTIWALFAGMLSAMSRDFLNLIRAIQQPVFWLSGIMYDVSKIDVQWIQSALSYNPVTIIATGFRKTLIEQEWFFEDLYLMRCYLICLIAISLLAIWAYKKTYKDIPDVL